MILMKGGESRRTTNSTNQEDPTKAKDSERNQAAGSDVEVLNWPLKATNLTMRFSGLLTERHNLVSPERAALSKAAELNRYVSGELWLFGNFQ